MSRSEQAGHELADELRDGHYGLPEAGFRLDGRSAVVTGASRNIGLSLALAFVQAGADVLMVARGRERLEQAVRAVRERCPDGRVEARAADVGEAEGIEQVGLAVDEAFGHADILVNNAAATGREGVPAGTGVLELPDESWEATYRTNVLGPFRLVRRLFPTPVEGRDRAVINVLSGSGFQPVPEPRSIAYGASKAALWMATRYLAHHLAPHVRVNALVPGVVTPDGRPQTELARSLESAIPMGRLGTPDELAGAAVYLASGSASYTTGEVIFCNGGRPW